MHVPRIVKILFVVVILLGAWQFLHSRGNASEPESEGEGGVRLTAPLEVFADGVVHDIYSEAVLFMHHGSPVGGRMAYFLYYRPIPDSPHRIIEYLRSADANILRSVSGDNWYVSATLPFEGNSVTVDFYPDREKNALVVMVR